eukprot:NODE_1450_length_1527_cov_25.417456_g1309_i0.p1 GENE.NODE_1450_length_1527_cov_25.417456_g1309_i0~~NODE_1450_length_1527_cov_25.417456_g1309_i0.p1  ORF type:complete len:380 (-),score=62.46 NODE_1450_length_1527_cov_25.417456_g1309_i0:91-1230(-)
MASTMLHLDEPVDGVTEPIPQALVQRHIASPAAAASPPAAAMINETTAIPMATASSPPYPSAPNSSPIYQLRLQPVPPPPSPTTDLFVANLEQTASHGDPHVPYADEHYPKLRVRDRVSSLCSRYPCSSVRQVNCLFLGRLGHGKSSLINTLYQTMTGTNDNLCEVGLGEESKTLKYAWCAELCFKQVLPLVFFDTKGLPDASDEANMRLIRRLFAGKFKPEHSMSHPSWTDYNIVGDRRLKIDAVIFVYAYGAPFPHRLAAAVYQQAQLRNLTVIPVMTHYDLVANEREFHKICDLGAVAFNTKPVTLANLGALNLNPFNSTPEDLELQQKRISFAKETAVSLVSQIMVNGQKYHRLKNYDTTKPFDQKSSRADCAIL